MHGGSRENAGRKARSPDQKRSIRKNILLNKHELELLERASEISGQKLSGFIRKTVLMIARFIIVNDTALQGVSKTINVIFKMATHQQGESK